MADISKVRAEADIVKARLNAEFKEKVAALTASEITGIIDTLEKTGVNPVEVSALKLKVEQATNKNQTLVRVLDTPGAICEQVKNILRKIR